MALRNRIVYAPVLVDDGVVGRRGERQDDFEMPCTLATDTCTVTAVVCAGCT